MDQIIKKFSELKISVIIPCYNSGEYLLEAIESVEKYSNKNEYEIVIVNDGSTNLETLNLLKDLKATNRYKVIDQINKGPGAARNTGIRNSVGRYLLFLDSDNKIKLEYLTISLKILSENEQVGVVYGNPSFLGADVTRYYYPQKFDRKALLHSNYIDICSVIRRQVWDDVGGFDENRELSQEDWEFWIRVSKTNWEFYHVDEILYEYRIRQDSHVTASKENLYKLLQYVYTKHIDLFVDQYLTTEAKLAKYQRVRDRPLQSFTKYIFNKIFNGNKQI